MLVRPEYDMIPGLIKGDMRAMRSALSVTWLLAVPVEFERLSLYALMDLLMPITVLVIKLLQGG